MILVAIAILLLPSLAVIALLSASGYAVTRLRRPKLAAVLAACFVVALVGGNRWETHSVHIQFCKDGCDQSPATHQHWPLNRRGRHGS